MHTRQNLILLAFRLLINLYRLVEVLWADLRLNNPSQINTMDGEIFSDWCLNEEWDLVRDYLLKSTDSKERKQQILQWKDEDDDYTCLHEAINTSDVPIDIVRAIIDLRSDIVFETDLGGATPFHYACYYNSSFEIIKMLLHVGGTKLLKQQDMNKDTALHMACKTHKDVNVLKLLIRTGGLDLVKMKNEGGHEAMVGLEHIVEEVMLIENYVDIISSKGMIDNEVEYIEKIISFNPSFSDIYRIITMNGIPNHHRSMFLKYRDEKLFLQTFVRAIVDSKPSKEDIDEITSMEGITMEQLSSLMEYRKTLA